MHTSAGWSTKREIIVPYQIALGRAPIGLNRLQGRPELSAWASIRVHAVVVALVALTLYASDPLLTLLVGGGLITPLYLWLGIVEARRTPLIFGPLSFYFLWNVIGLGLSPFYATYLIRTDGFLSFSVVEISPYEVAVGYVLYLLGSLAFHAGMQLLRPGSDYQRPVPGNPSRLAKALLVMGAIGVAILAKPAWFEALGNIARPMQAAPLTSLVIFALLSPDFFRVKRDLFGAMFGLGTAVLFAVNIRSGSKAILMFSFLPLVWTVLLRRDHRWLTPLFLSLAALYFVVIAPTVNRARETSLLQSESSVSHLLHSFGAEQESENLFTAVPRQIEAFLIRQFDPMPVSFVFGEVRRNGYKMGETMRYAAYAFIPRLLWPDKPAVARGAWFYAYVGGSPRESEATTSLGITAAGELYWNFGLAGLLIGMFAIGCGYSTLWRMAGTRPLTQPLHMLLYVLISVYGMIDMPEAVTVFAAIVSNLLMFGSVFLLFDRSWRGKEISNRVRLMPARIARPIGS